MATIDVTEFGSVVREKYFMLDPEGVFINHGSYGVLPKRVYEKQLELRREMESHPDSWYRRLNIAYYRDSLRVLCRLINAVYENVVFVENVTFGINSVLRSLEWNADDVILLSNLTYHSLTIMAEDLEQRYGTRTEFVNVNFPIESEEEFLQTYRRKLESCPNIKLAIIDHVSSPSSVLVPVKKLSSLCHEFGVLVMVDGANATGQVKVDMADLGVDFYTGNLHKWMFTPRGSGFLWVSSTHVHRVKPAVISHFHGSQFHYDFCVRGTRDDTPYYSLGEAVAFVEQLGGWDVIYKHNTELLDAVMTYLEREWNTHRFSLPTSMTCPYVRLIKVPDMENYPKTPTGGKALEDDLFTRFNIQVLCQHMPGNQLYFRISGHVYNTMDDYHKLAGAVNTLRREPKKDRPKPLYELAMMHWELSPLDQ